MKSKRSTVSILLGKIYETSFSMSIPASLIPGFGGTGFFMLYIEVLLADLVRLLEINNCNRPVKRQSKKKWNSSRENSPSLPRPKITITLVNMVSHFPE